MNPAKTTPSPKPEIFYLPALFRSIRSGEIRIPAFQRGFVWKPAQVIELLESVYQGFPIGSLLFWRVTVDAMQSDKSVDTPFPHPPVVGEVDFVLDGMQRISSLFGAFNGRDGAPPPDDPFAIVFDLETERFLPARESGETCIDLRRLFQPRQLLEEQGRLAKLVEGERLVDRTLELQRIFQEYLVPLVRISNATVEQVVQIFERVNNTGTRLSAVDFMRAVTWSDQFDLTNELYKISDKVADLGFNIPQDTLAKVIALAMDIAPTGEEMVRLREKSAKSLLAATKRTIRALKATLQFFQSELQIFSYDFVPYEGQFLVAASIATKHDSAFPGWYKDWFWTVGFSESLQGRPDHAIARLAIDARNARPLGIPERFSLTSEAVRFRAIRKGAAMGTAFVAAMATGPVTSVFTGDRLAPSDMTAAFERSMLGAVFDRATMASQLQDPPKTDRIVGNTILLGHDERHFRSEEIREAIIQLANRRGGAKLLRCQLIDETCVRALEQKDVGAFLTARGTLIVERAKALSAKIASPEGVHS